ncbi:carbohydrate ABC transporter permease [Saliterribacillus persicus]|uniref:Multiple sugar transport system permease protein n=1 Tax=Saliterribacillus persicus TaxID=930114 RepID=A0A368YGN0_9BACI|nr:sugar ABC transporter permease [Saliterribacillus persicus]RCW77344.1 multiple sugar transport system permease protein [Saliterribacillus persicus]
MKRFNKKYLVAFMFLLPSLIGLSIFVLYPILASLVMSFTNWDGLTPMKFNGIENYIQLWKDETFKISLINNFYYTGVSVPLTIIFSVLLAIMMNAKVKGIGVFRVLYFLPNVTAAIAVGVIWSSMFTKEGPINQVIALFIENPPHWLGSSLWAMPAIIIVSVWKGVGYFAIILLAGLQGIPHHLYEAATIDGANKWKQFIHVTVPVLSPVIFFCTIMAMISSFQVFDTIVAMTEGGPGRATNVLVYHIYNTAFLDFEFGYASAMSYILFIIILLVTIIQFRTQKRWVHY